MFRYPDRPVRSSVGILSTLRDGDWLAQVKMDGWRALVAWDGKRALLTSRHKEISRKGVCHESEGVRG